MADLSNVLPHFDLTPWRHLTFSLEKKGVTTSELIANDPIEIARRCPLPLNEVGRMRTAVLQALRDGLRHPPPAASAWAARKTLEAVPRKKAQTNTTDRYALPERPCYVKTLDERIDAVLGGGIAPGDICEVVGESAVGKTQFVLSLLLSAQLAPPYGPGGSVVYICTEGSLNTTRLMQMLRSNPFYQSLPPEQRPHPDRVITATAPNIQAQERIIEYQLPKLLEDNDVGLIVVDSMAANFRVEFQGASRKVLSDRAAALVKQANLLRKIGHDYGIAIVITNQVGDRFDDDKAIQDKLLLGLSQGTSSQSTQTPAVPNGQPQSANSPSNLNHQATNTGSQTHQPILPKQPSAIHPRKDDLLSLDYQQRFYTGWGDDPHASPHALLKTPALGHTWASLINARIVLKVSHENSQTASATGNIWSDVKRRRFLKVVYAPWVKPTMYPVEYTLEMQGLVSVPPKNNKKENEEDDFDVEWDDDESDGSEKVAEHADLLNPKYWEDEDEEFP